MRLIARMEIQHRHGAPILMQELNKVEGALKTFIDDLKAFLEQVARLIDPSMTTTSFVNAVERWDDIMARQRERAVTQASAFDNSPGMTEVVMPQLGESVAEGTIVRWIKHVGDKVDRDDPLLEISTDKVDAEIPSPVGGVLVEILAKEGKTVPVNGVIAVIRRG